MNRRDFLSRAKKRSANARKAANVRWANHRARVEARRNADAKWIADGGLSRALNQFCDDVRKADLFNGSTELYRMLKL